MLTYLSTAFSYLLDSLRASPLLSSLLFTAAMNDPLKVVRVTANDGKTNEARELAYTNCKVIGNGSFGVVFQARVVSGGNGNLVEGAGASQDQGAAGSAPKDSQEDVAIKKVLQDKRFKNRELQIMRIVKHPNVVDLRAYFYSNGDKVRGLKHSHDVNHF